MSNKKEGQLKDILLAENYVQAEDIKKAEKWAKDNNLSIADYFLSNNILTKDLLGQAISEHLKVPYADLNTNAPTKEQVLKIPSASAKKFRIVLFKEEEKSVTIATDNPKTKGLLAEIKRIFPHKKITINYSLTEDIDDNFKYYRQALEARFVKIIKNKKRIAPEIIDEIIKDALSLHASDIHFDAREKEVVIRFRIDGVLQIVGRISKEYYLNILNRIKVQAHLRTDEHFATQDGAIRHNVNGKTIDLRISVVPTVDGEKISIRLLSEYVRTFTLSDLGLSGKDQQVLEKASKSPFGMILVAGPTGSGKTTTLYGVIKNINRPEVNIITIEDPVEYKIEGVNHIQVNARTNLTFTKGLRSIVRQDPDIILVGEIRDTETAEIGVNAALTGHLLFSTFHANDAATVVPRLLNMGIEPFLLASTLELIISQRLLRKICDHCRYSYIQSTAEIKKKISNHAGYFPGKKITLYKGKGCNSCNHTGYSGRIGIFEFIRITSQMQDLILKDPSSGQIWNLARKQGAHSLFDDGLEKVKNGITTIDELLRVAMPS